MGHNFVNDELPDAVEHHRVATLVGGRQMHTMALLAEGNYDFVIVDHVSCQFPERSGRSNALISNENKSQNPNKFVVAATFEKAI